ncbi:MAG: M20/M25/M40 family metallo-hydrolase [Gemmatales bacterium]|nr:M20/M25/M40 family metallo-hydrolase [Gemmatales bacterium]MDW8387819.1 M20/M25/M40 family metallo-hydrolase [Gemmatales bacterium]
MTRQGNPIYSRGRISILNRGLLAVLAATVLCLLAVPPLPADPQGSAEATALAIDRKIIEEAKNGSEIMANLTYLCDVIGPRLTGSANLKRANDWAAEKMRSYGLSNVRLEPWELPMGWERGTAYARIIEPDNGKVLNVAAMGWTPGTNGRIVGDVVVVNARNPEDLKKYEGKLKNAIVLRGPPANVRPITDLSFAVPGERPAPTPNRPENPDPAPERRNPNPPPAGQPRQAEERSQPDRPANPNPPRDPGQPPERTNPNQPPAGQPRPFDTRAAGEAMRFRREMAEFFRKEGVAALLQDAGKPHGLMSMTGSWGGRDRASAADPLPTLFVAHEHYALLYRLATRPEPAVTRLELEVTNKFHPGPIPVYNTIGEIPGCEKPDEFVIVGAHLDSWDLGQGATDNGTGSCVVLETARILMKAGIKPKRTIRFILYSGEEQGLHGSRAYCNLHKDELPKTSAALNHDTGTGRVTAIYLQGREVLKPIMERELVSLKELGVNEISTRSMGGSDHLSFESAGVPGFMFRQDPVEYRLTHHSQSDTLDKAREADLIQGAQVMAIMAVRIANLDDLLPREKRAPATTANPAAERQPQSGDAQKP